MKVVHILSCFIFSVISFSQEMNTKVKAKIEISSTEELLIITATAENLTDAYQSISYKLSVIKKADSNSNNSTNSQSGRETIAPNALKNLSKTQLNSVKNQEITLLLLIFDEKENIIGKDKILIGKKKISPN